MCLFCKQDTPLTTNDIAQWGTSPADMRKLYYGGGYASHTEFEKLRTNDRYRQRIMCKVCWELAQHNFAIIEQLAHADGWHPLTHKNLHITAVYEGTGYKRRKVGYQCTGLYIAVGYGLTPQAAIHDYQCKIPLKLLVLGA